MRQIEIDISVPRPLERCPRRPARYSRAFRPFCPGSISEPTLVTMTTRSLFFLAFIHLPMIVSDSPPLLPGPPGRIGIGRVDTVEAQIDEGIEHGEGRLFVRRPAEHIAAEHERRNRKPRRAKRAFGDGHEILPKNESRPFEAAMAGPVKIGKERRSNARSAVPARFERRAAERQELPPRAQSPMRCLSVLFCAGWRRTMPGKYDWSFSAHFLA